MSVGYPEDKSVIDARAGALVIDLRNALEAVSRMKAWLDTLSTADLVAKGYVEDDTTTEVSILKSAFTDLDNLAKLARANGVQAQPNNFFYWADRLTKMN